jgi:hypothetical protein
MALQNVRFHLFTIHAHLKNGAPNYANLFKLMTNLRGHYHEVRKRQVAVGDAKLLGNNLFLIIYSGRQKNLLVFDRSQQREFNEITSSIRFQARKTRAMISPENRQLLIEAGRGRITSDELASMIEAQAHDIPEFRTLDLVFTPVAAEEFFATIDSMTRIQSASVTIARPNVDWNDSYSALTSIADESQAKAIDATIRARRSASISKQKGLIPAIKGWVKGAKSPVQGAKIKGEKAGHTGLITLRLSDHVQRIDIPVELSPNKEEPSDEELEQKLLAYFESKSKENA